MSSSHPRGQDRSESSSARKPGRREHLLRESAMWNHALGLIDNYDAIRDELLMISERRDVGSSLPDWVASTIYECPETCDDQDTNRKEVVVATSQQLQEVQAGPTADEYKCGHPIRFIIEEGSSSGGPQSPTPEAPASLIQDPDYHITPPRASTRSCSTTRSLERTTPRSTPRNSPRDRTPRSSPRGPAQSGDTRRLQAILDPTQVPTPPPFVPLPRPSALPRIWNPLKDSRIDPGAEIDPTLLQLWERYMSNPRIERSVQKAHMERLKRDTEIARARFGHSPRQHSPTHSLIDYMDPQ